MKKNKAMRLASVLLVLTLLTTCMTAGTFAKYTTGAEGEATARVAKFGVNVSVTPGDVFKNNYNGTVTTGKDGVTVAGNLLVAPGTNGEMTFSVTGKPETKVELQISLNKSDTDLKEVMLNKGTYKDVTTGKEVTLNEAYYPVRWTLKNTNGSVIDGLANKKLSEIEAYLKGENTVKKYDPNTDLTTLFANNNSDTGNYTLLWEWPIGTDDEVNTKDTLLGNIQSGTSLVQKKGDGDSFGEVTSEDYCLEEAFKLTISVTQVD